MTECTDMFRQGAQGKKAVSLGGGSQGVVVAAQAILLQTRNFMESICYSRDIYWLQQRGDTNDDAN